MPLSDEATFFVRAYNAQTVPHKGRYVVSGGGGASRPGSCAVATGRDLIAAASPRMLALFWRTGFGGVRAQDSKIMESERPDHASRGGPVVCQDYSVVRSASVPGKSRERRAPKSVPLAFNNSMESL